MANILPSERTNANRTQSINKGSEVFKANNATFPNRVKQIFPYPASGTVGTTLAHLVDQTRSVDRRPLDL